jgi:hypothetical protein
MAVGCSYPRVRVEVDLTREQRQTLQRDLAIGLHSFIAAE